MNKRLLTGISIFLATVTILLLVLLLRVYSDRKNPPKKDDVVYAIRRSIKYLGGPPEVRERAICAINKWENGVVDSEPILIYAVLLRPEGTDEVNLALAVFDENKDIIGFGIKEEHKSPDGQIKEIDETYPAFMNHPLDCIANVWPIKIHIRTQNQRKDEKLWQEYVNDPNRIKSIIGITYYSYPPVWVSIPEPNKVDVQVWVYDKAGNKSEAVELLNFVNSTEESKNTNGE